MSLFIHYLLYLLHRSWKQPKPQTHRQIPPTCEPASVVGVSANPSKRVHDGQGMRVARQVLWKTQKSEMNKSKVKVRLWTLPMADSPSEEEVGNEVNGEAEEGRQGREEKIGRLHHRKSVTPQSIHSFPL